MDNFDNAKSPKKHSGAFNPSRSLGIDRAHYVALEADDPPPLLASRSIIWDFFLFMSTRKAATISAPTVLTPIHSSIRAAITARSTTSPMSCTISMTCWRQRNC